MVESDLSIFFEQQLDPEANRMAAFTSKDPADMAAFLAHWSNIMSDDTKVVRTILLDERIVGHIASYTDQEFGKPEVTYWIGKKYWGKGMATAALLKFLGVTRNRQSTHVLRKTILPLVVSCRNANSRLWEKGGDLRMQEERKLRN